MFVHRIVVIESMHFNVSDNSNILHDKTSFKANDIVTIYLSKIYDECNMYLRKLYWLSMMKVKDSQNLDKDFCKNGQYHVNNKKVKAKINDK